MKENDQTKHREDYAKKQSTEKHNRISSYAEPRSTEKLNQNINLLKK